VFHQLRRNSCTSEGGNAVRSRSRAVWAIILVLTAVSVAVVLWVRQTRPPNLKPDALAATAPITAADRLLVVAPHCDDEVLGAGGLIRDAAAVGAQVKVILMTNGDGFRYAVETEEKTVRATPAQYVQFAYERQAETVAAVTSPTTAVKSVSFARAKSSSSDAQGVDVTIRAQYPAFCERLPFRSISCCGTGKR
jgi:hypothetical protein